MKSKLFKNERQPGKVIVMTFIILGFLFITGSLSAQNNVKLAYNMPAGKTLNYKSVTSISQLMDIQGQSMEVMVNTSFGFRVKMVEKAAGNLKINVIVDSLTMSIDAMGGLTNSRVREIENKSFNMIISPVGEIVDLSEAENIKFNVESQGTSNLSQTFRNVFPVLPDKAVKPGDTWSSVDTIRSAASAASTLQVLESSYRYDDVEKVNGIDCAKISSSISGTAETRAQNMGMDIFYSGPVNGQVLMYFALKEGYFMKQDISTTMNGNIEISGAENMSFPITVNTATTTEAR